MHFFSIITRNNAILRLKDKESINGAKEALQFPITKPAQTCNDFQKKSGLLSGLLIVLLKLSRYRCFLLSVILLSLSPGKLLAADDQYPQTDSNKISEKWFYIASENRPRYSQFFEQIKQQLHVANITRLDSNQKIQCSSDNKANTYFITAGISALRKIQHCTNKASIFGFYLTQQQFFNLSKQSNNAYKDANIFFADQPLIRQLALAKYFFPKSNNVGVLYDESVQHQINYFNRRKPDFINLSNFQVNSQDELLSQLSKATTNSDFILALIDNKIYNSRNAKSILLSTYRKNVPLFGGTRGFVKAGVVASCYSEPQYLIKEFTNFINSHPQAKGTRHYPIYFEIEQNRAVIKSLDLKKSDNKIIKKFISKTLLLWRNK